MKIKDILGEDGTTVAGISGDKAKLSNGQEVDAKLLTPDTKHPGQFTMPEMDPAAIKPGAVVNTGDEQTSEEYEDEDDHPGHVHYNDWMNSEYAPHDDDSGDDNKVFHKAVHFLHSRDVHPGDIEFHAHHMANKFHGSGIDEEHDTIEDGGEDIGGDPTDDFIDDVRDKSFEKHAKGDGSQSPFSEGLSDILGLNKSPEEWAKSSTQMAKLLQFKQQYKGTPYEAQIDQRIQLLKDRLDIAGTEVAGPGGTPKPVVDPKEFDNKQLKESDDRLLDKMLTIAGLR